MLMSTPIVLLLYFVTAAILVFFSVKCANYVDLLDKKTDISGAFIGGMILAAVTSLPELVTSISAIYVVHNAELIVGNVLGSNIFNLCIFGALTTVAVRNFSKASIGQSHLKMALCTIIAFIMTGVTLFTGFGRIPFVNINLASLVILVVYVVSIRFLSGDDGESEGEDDSPLTVRQIAVRFFLMAAGLVAASVAVTYLTDQLSIRLNLSASLAGALFLGVATSLPELSSSIQLVRLKNFNAMLGNVLGSNMFNFTILSVADIIAGNTAVYVNSYQTSCMLICAMISTLLTMVALLAKRRMLTSAKGAALLWYAVPAVLTLVSYGTFLVLSVQ